MQDPLLHLFGRRFADTKDHASPWSYETPSLPFLRPADPLCVFLRRAENAKKPRREPELFIDLTCRMAKRSG